jgi:hypothetical protein
MTHDYHQGLPGYHPDQLLIDGCEECEDRAKHPDHGIAELDAARFRAAWARAAEWQRHGLPSLSSAEAPMLLALWAVQVQLERIGWPIGEIPDSAFVDSTVSSRLGRDDADFFGDERRERAQAQAFADPAGDQQG